MVPISQAHEAENIDELKDEREELTYINQSKLSKGMILTKKSLFKEFEIL